MFSGGDAMCGLSARARNKREKQAQWQDFQERDDIQRTQQHTRQRERLTHSSGTTSESRPSTSSDVLTTTPRSAQSRSAGAPDPLAPVDHLQQTSPAHVALQHDESVNPRSSAIARSTHRTNTSTRQSLQRRTIPRAVRSITASSATCSTRPSRLSNTPQKRDIGVTCP